MFDNMTPQEAAEAIVNEIERDDPMDAVVAEEARQAIAEACQHFYARDKQKIHSTAEDLNVMVALCHGRSKAAGWWDGVDPNDKNVYGAKIALIHSEASESLEGDRKDLMDDHLPHRKMAEVELADLIIRVCDLAGAKGFDLGGAVAEKLEYNRTRKDHTREARAAAGGKKI